MQHVYRYGLSVSLDNVRMLYKAKKSFSDLKKDISKANKTLPEGAPEAKQVKELDATVSKALADVDYYCALLYVYTFFYTVHL